jgi:phage gp36-like protein
MRDAGAGSQLVPYCTLIDIFARIPEESVKQLTDDEGANEVVEDRVNQAIADADALIDGYLGGRHSLPLDPVPSLITKLAVDISIYNLYARKIDTELPKAVSERYQNAMKVLDQIQKGMVTLGVGNEVSGASATGGTGTYRSNKTNDDRIFPKDELEKM